MLGPIAIAIIITLVISIPVTAFIAKDQCKKEIEGKIGNAEDKAREIIDEALKTAEAKKREGLLEVKEESIRTKNELDKEIKERRAEAQRTECSRRRRTSTRKPMPSKRKKTNWQKGKRRCAGSGMRLPG